jgi:hypothetical protein
MTNVQVRDVPEDVVALLKQRAGETGQSLQSYLLTLLTAEAGVVRNDAILDAVSRRKTGWRAGPDDAAELIRQGRRERDEHLMGLIQHGSDPTQR